MKGLAPMKNKSLLMVIIALILVLVIGLLIVKSKKSTSDSASPIDSSEPELAINTIPLSERPFITLSPDSSGRSLNISVSGAPKSGSLEYEMIYDADGKQEGALGTLQLATEIQPIVKSILLGTRSAGGATTYSEGVTGGSLTVTYATTRLKESWNYLHFDPLDPTLSSTDVRFTLTFQKTALKKDAVIIVMKTFGYDKTGLAEEAKVVSGPYGYFSQSPVKGSVEVSLKLPAGEFINPTIYAYQVGGWTALETKLDGDTVSSTASSGNVFLVIAD